MSLKDFGLKEGEPGDNKKFKVLVSFRDDKNIHTAQLVRIKKGIFWGEKLVPVCDLVAPCRKVEDEINETKLKLEQLEATLKSKQQEAMNIIRTFEPNIFEDKSIFSRLTSKIKDDKEKPKTRTVIVGLTQNHGKDNHQQHQKGKGNPTQR